jgi:RND superfamily putative drug exporter
MQFLMFGSVLVPLKAVILNFLSLTATFGAIVWVFQEGHGASLLGFTPTPLDTMAPIVLFCVAFGLSMDYEVFLLSRIKEEHDRGSDNVTAVAMGLERTGRIVTAAAACLGTVLVSVGLAASITTSKLFSLGLAVAILVDATVIRGLLVPAVMRLAGDANWWAPRPLRRLRQLLMSRKLPHDDVPPP